MGSLVGVAVETANNVGYRGKLRPEVFALLPPLKAGLRVLDIGCGEGLFSTQIEGVAETWGIEPEARSAEIAGERLHRVFRATYDEVKAELPQGYFDLVVCNDVIEHMTDHDAFLRSIQEHMAPGAYLVGSLPNVRSRANLFNLIVARDWHYQDSGVLDRTHFRFFTFKSLRRSLEEAGFAVRRLEGLNSGPMRGWGPRLIAERVFSVGLGVLAGATNDTRFLQIGFLVTASTGD